MGDSNLPAKLVNILCKHKILKVVDLIKSDWYYISSIREVSETFLARIYLYLSSLGFKLPETICVYWAQYAYKRKHINIRKIAEDYQLYNTHKMSSQQSSFTIDKKRIECRKQARKLAEEACLLLVSEYADAYHSLDSNQQDFQEAYWNSVKEKLYDKMQEYASVSVDLRDIRSSVAPMTDHEAKAFENSKTMPFGKFIGERMRDVPLSYLLMLSDNLAFIIKCISYLKNDTVKRECLKQNLVT